MQDIFTLKAIYSVSLMMLEIPAGYFADVSGRRNSLLFGSVLGFGGYLIYTGMSGFWSFMIAEIVLGAGMSLVSGADSAMLYDTLASDGKGDLFTRYEGRITSFGNFAEAFAGIAGGLLAASSLILPFYFQAGVSFLAIPASLALMEPPVGRVIRKPDIREVVSIIRMVMHRDRRLFWNTIFSSVTGVSTLTMAWFAQPWMMEAKLPVTLFGVAWAVLNLTAGVLSMQAWKITCVFGEKTTTITFTLMMALCWFGLAVSAYMLAVSDSILVVGTGALMLLLFYSGRGVATPTLRNAIHRITDSEIRATVLSIRNVLIRGLFALLGPLFGLLTDQFSLSWALGLAGFLFTLSGMFSLYFFLKYNPVD
jgi:MFS family permease